MTSILTFKWLWVQDVHFGVTSVPIGAVTASFKCVYEAAKRRGIKKVVFGGDTTDRPLSLVNDYASEFIQFIIWLLKDADENDIEIIIIEGTPGHDWKQARLFEQIKKELGLEAKLVYITKLAIIHLEDFGNVLVVPDQWRPNASTTFNEVLTLLKEKNLTQVDYAFMHGSFKYQVPSFLRNRSDLHEEEEYCRIVKKAIFIGHEHGYSTYKHIYCAGSLERTKHGQEEEKGAFFVEEMRSGSLHVEFLRNSKAQIFKDVFVDGLTSDEILSRIEDMGVDLEQPANIRLVAMQDAQVVAEFIKKYKLIYSEIKWSLKNLSSPSEKTDDFQLEQANIEFQKINLDVGTITSLLMRRIEDKYPDKSGQIEVLFNETIESNV